MIDKPAFRLYLSILSYWVVIVGNLLNDDATLYSVGVNSEQTVHIEVQSVDPINAPLKLLNNSPDIPLKQNTPYKMPDVLTVRVESGN